MQFRNMLLAAAAASGALATTSICDKYTTALLKNNTAANQYTLLALLVNTAVIGNYTGPYAMGANAKLPGSNVKVPGILAPGMAMGQSVKLAPYFSGALASTYDDSTGKAVSMNFLDGGGAKPMMTNATSPGAAGSNQEMLLTHLYQYFGYALGCSMYGMGAFPKYGGSNNMAQVHQYMDLNEAQIYYFIDQVGLAAKSFGASMTDVTAVGKLLNTTFGMKCSAPAPLIKGMPAEPQAICQDTGCPEAANPMCSAYKMEASPKNATAAQMSAASSSASMMSGSATSMASASAASSTGGAVAVGVSGAMMGLAGLAAAAAL